MRKISSSMTFASKKIFPVVWFGFLAVMAAVVLPDAMQMGAWFLLLPLLAMSAIGYAVMRWMIFDLVDEVYLQNDEIIVRNSGEEDRFSVTNVLNVNVSTMTNPERITLTLREPCKFGDEVTFLATLRFPPFGTHPLVKELIDLAHRR
jgi:hypothetical protein